MNNEHTAIDTIDYTASMAGGAFDPVRKCDREAYNKLLLPLHDQMEAGETLKAIIASAIADDDRAYITALCVLYETLMQFDDGGKMAGRLRANLMQAGKVLEKDHDKNPRVFTRCKSGRYILTVKASETDGRSKLRKSVSSTGAAKTLASKFQEQGSEEDLARFLGMIGVNPDTLREFADMLESGE